MSKRTGVWIIGAFGGVATTVAVGLFALRKKLTANAGLVSALPAFQSLPLLDWNDLVIGGHEIRQTSALDAAMKLANESRAIDRYVVEQVSDELQQLTQNVRPGLIRNCGQAIQSISEKAFISDAGSPRDLVDAVKKDLAQFITNNKLERLIVVNLASTEPPADEALNSLSWSALNKNLNRSNFELPSSCLYAIAAMESGHSFINFTPSVGSNLNALRELATAQKVCHVGRDGKTGETFLKSVLAPAFGARNLEIMSWVGHNIFGNMDGQILDDPNNKSTKVKSKDSLLGNILGYQPQTHTSIEYIPSLGDWKTAWDHIHFRGFLGTPMVLQFTWQGCDSILAAPLVLDLIRFVDLAAQRGEFGELFWLSSFFKSPQGTAEQNFAKQYSMLLEWAHDHE